MEISEHKYHSSQKILTPTQLTFRLAYWRFKQFSIVFTNGCFDIIHAGHIDYLEKAANLGDQLIIGINTDASIKMLKGNLRPIQSEEARTRILAAMEFVSAVILFNEPTPLALIKLIQPDMLVKGSDYTREAIVGQAEVSAWGGIVQTIPLLEGYSTTTIIEQIKNQ